MLDPKVANLWGKEADFTPFYFYHCFSGPLQSSYDNMDLFIPSIGEKMVRKYKFIILPLVVILFVFLVASCSGQNITLINAPAILAQSTIPVEADTKAAITPAAAEAPMTATTMTKVVVTGTTSSAIPTVAAPTATTTNTVKSTVPQANFPLTILHTNDVHAHHAPNTDGDGGEALAASVIAQVRANNPNTLLLSAGDTFIGTLFYVMHHGIDSAKLMNMLKYDAMTLGNHEFDEGDGNLALFIEQLKFPVVAANVNFDGSAALKDKIAPYVILQKGSQKIGVIGLANPETPSMSRPGSGLIFESDLAQVVQSSVDNLTKEGVNKIIVLSHIGFQNDMKLASTVTGVDIIVGGHTHTLLANFDTRAAGVYPAEAKNPQNKTVLVVQAGEYLEYIGKLEVEFDPNGELVNWKGDTVYLSHYITPDPAVSALTKTLYTPIDALTRKVISKSAVYLEGDRKVCRFMECNLGNLITDAMRAETGAQVALENGGGIRASIKQGDVTLGDVLTVLPFGNLVSTLRLSGEDLLAALENGVSKIEGGEGRFLQVSGLRYQIDPSQPAGSRIVSVEVLDTQGNYQALDPKTVYTVATNDFISGGGDGYSVIAKKGINVYDFGRPLDEMLADYMKAHTPIDIKVDGRITIK
jgi:5'-nucleotidase / UDP-sugar diphosphatase